MRSPRLTWGSGPLTAVLVHGYTDDADTWWRVGPALAAHGYTVHAVDLAGHGLGTRVERYDLDVLLRDLVAAVPRDVDLLLGHSLGAVLVDLVAAELAPVRVVLVDPPWGPLPDDLDRVPGDVDVEAVTAAAPHWSAEDVRVDVVSSQRLDPGVTAWLSGDPLHGQQLPLGPPPVPTLVVVPAEGALVPLARRDELEAIGYAFVEVPGVAHVIHRDDPDAFLAACAQPHSSADSRERGRASSSFLV